jgi:hypothetical protein
MLPTGTTKKLQKGSIGSWLTVFTTKEEEMTLFS